MTEHITENKNISNRKSFGAYVSVLAATAALLAGCADKVEATPPHMTTPAPSTETVTETTSLPPVTETVTVTRPAPTETEQPPTPSTDAVDCLVQKCIALTFDDGPGPYTEQLLEDLSEHNAKATFFWVGNRVANYADVARDVRDDGHQIGNHSWAHDDLTVKGASAAANDIARTNTEILDNTGVMPDVMRPPYGATNQSIVNAVDMPEILWSVDPEDWKYRDSDYVANYVINHADRGDIVLMHDIHQTTVNAVPRILDALQSEGYKLVTIDTLYGGSLNSQRYFSQDDIRS